MPKCSVEILTPALKDIEKIADYYLLTVSPQSAEKITDKLLDAINMLEEHPLAGAEHSDHVLQEQGYRKLICSGYVCVYRIIDNIVYIYRVVHGSMDYPRLFKYT